VREQLATHTVCALAARALSGSVPLSRGFHSTSSSLWRPAALRPSSSLLQRAEAWGDEDGVLDELDEDAFDEGEMDDEVDTFGEEEEDAPKGKRGGAGGKGKFKQAYDGPRRNQPSEAWGSSGAPVVRAKRMPRGPSLLESNAQADLSGVTFVRNRADAERVLAILNSPDVRSRFHAVDTEVKDIDVRTDSPVGHGRVTCLSIYVGPDVDFGNGPKLWIDTMDTAEEGSDPLAPLPQPPKLEVPAAGTAAAGEAAIAAASNAAAPASSSSTPAAPTPSAPFSFPGSDAGESTLQLFKGYLEDPSILKVWHNYSFDRHVLGNHGIAVRGFGGDTMHMARLENAARDKYALEVLSADFLGVRKRPMKELFVRPKLKKDGTPGRATELPPVEEIQRDPFFRPHWIYYSTYDTQSTWEIRQVLEQRLRSMEWIPPEPLPDGSLPPKGTPPAPGKSMYDFYTRYWRPFGELLADLESVGIFVHARTHLPVVEKQAEADKARHMDHFRSWAMAQQPAACDMNIHSATQKQHFFFAGAGVERKFSADNVEGYVEPGSKSGKPKKKRDFLLQGMGLPVIETTETKMPAVSLKVLKQLAGKMGDPDAGVAPKYGLAYAHFGGGESGKAACEAIDALCKVSAVNIMLNTFIKPLQTQTDVNGRIHCSLNLNTETGRLSSRKPNLQNQPALEKDIYKIRAAFAAAPGKKLVVADYGQLELRILAHIADCRSMIEAFELGGDFHSRTAMGMYPHVATAVADGSVLLEWDYAKNGGAAPPKPMLKDVFGAERRKAKTLNFSIAYGKTARGLSNDWNVSLEEAEETLASWYRDRPEVKQWQEDTIADAHACLCTRTLMGRYRPLPLINSRNKGEMRHSERAAINTPIQGGAADVVMKAMLLLHYHPRFNELGWKILLQIHDEIICEGPAESADEALQIVKHTMSNPFKKPLRVELVVDANIGDTWYEAK